MSELTAYNSERIYWAVEQVEQEAGDIEDLHLDDNLFYLKSEADKFIAELEADCKEACGRLQTANLIKDEQLAATRHHKYKRCLAMAERCEICALFYGNLVHKVLKKDIADPSRQKVFRRLKYHQKWHKRWLELAKKFKEA